jgi:hypothetical protein
MPIITGIAQSRRDRLPTMEEWGFWPEPKEMSPQPLPASWPFGPLTERQVDEMVALNAAAEARLGGEAPVCRIWEIDTHADDDKD